MSGICKPLFNTPLNRDHPLAKGLVASYLFNENSGRTVYDSSGNKNHGTMIGFGADDTPTSGWVAGPHGVALKKNESVSPINYISLGNIDFTGGAIKTVIINIKSNVDLTSVIDKRFLSGNYFEMYFDRGSVHVRAYDTTFRVISVNINSLDINKPFNIIYTMSRNDLNLYVNLLFSHDSTFQPTPHAWNTNIGCAYDNTRPCTSIDINFLSLYSRVLSPEEISYLSAFPYCMYEQEDSIFSKPFNQNFYRQLLAGGY